MAPALNARESKQKRKENALAVRSILTYLPRVGDAYEAKGSAEAGFAYQKALDEFAKIKDRFQGKKKQNITKQFDDFGKLLKTRAPLDTILLQQNQLRRDLAELFLIEERPAQIPDKILGADVYQARCAVCHGSDGKVGTALAKRLSPSPSDLTLRPLNQSLSPFRVYNMLITGIEGTSKKPMDTLLSDHELWSVAFYALSLICGKKTPLDHEMAMPRGLNLRAVAAKTNYELTKEYKLTDKQLCNLRSQKAFEPSLSRD